MNRSGRLQWLVATGAFLQHRLERQVVKRLAVESQEPGTPEAGGGTAASAEGERGRGAVCDHRVCTKGARAGADLAEAGQISGFSRHPERRHLRINTAAPGRGSILPSGTMSGTAWTAGLIPGSLPACTFRFAAMGMAHGVSSQGRLCRNCVIRWRAFAGDLSYFPGGSCSILRKVGHGRGEQRNLQASRCVCCLSACYTGVPVRCPHRMLWTE